MAFKTRQVFHGRPPGGTNIMANDKDIDPEESDEFYEKCVDDMFDGQDSEEDLDGDSGEFEEDEEDDFDDDEDPLEGDDEEPERKLKKNPDVSCYEKETPTKTTMIPSCTTIMTIPPDTCQKNINFLLKAEY